MRNGTYTHVTLAGTTIVEETDEFDLRDFRAMIERTNPDLTQSNDDPVIEQEVI